MATAPLEVYRTHMMELKLRLVHCEKVCEATTPVTGLLALDAEFCFLQIRRMVELIAFSSALRDEERYKAFRKLQSGENARDHGDHARDWEAPEILKRLMKISAYCLPIPLKEKVRREGTLTRLDRKDISVSHGRLIEIYNLCGGFLHAKNPFHEDYASHVEAERRKYLGAKQQITKHLQFLRKLMWLHAAVRLAWSEGSNPMHASEPVGTWIVSFGQDGDAVIQIAVAEAQ